MVRGYMAPMVYFGGKSTVADVVWGALKEDVDRYLEPFAGTLAVLMLRPQPGKVEVVNDADGFVSNLWRGIQADPEAVAAHADHPISEVDLHARHVWLLGQRERITERLMGDPEFFDPKVAGWWVWGINCWIGNGWCDGRGPWQSVDGVLTNTRAERGRDNGLGVDRKRPDIHTPKGVNAIAGRGTCAERRASLVEYLRSLSDRLRGVRVCCGDWSRVCGPVVMDGDGIKGVFLDPPYADLAKRRKGLYSTDCLTVAHQVREWAIERGKRPDVRIVLAGYEGEHEMPADWRTIEWHAFGGYGVKGNGDGHTNRKRERLWCSPACIVRLAPAV